jgi:mono/diheme cytochrome c family protein/AraC-like DNA-binding protein
MNHELTHRLFFRYFKIFKEIKEISDSGHRQEGRMNHKVLKSVRTSLILTLFNFAACNNRTNMTNVIVPIARCVEGNINKNCSNTDQIVENLDSLRNQASKILDSNCSSCHAKGNALGNFGDVLNFDLLLKTESKYVTAGAPENSLLFKRISDEKQPMPPTGRMSQDKIDIIRRWIATEGHLDPKQKRERISMSSVFKIIRDDFDRQQDRMNIRYFHFVHLWNSGTPESEISLQRQALSKLINMLSTKETITKPVAIDGAALIFRINLSHYGLESAYGLSDPVNPLARIGRWKEVFEGRRPSRDSAVEDAFFASRFVVKPPEYLGDSSVNCKNSLERPYYCNRDLMWMKTVMMQPNPSQTKGDRNSVLDEYISYSAQTLSFTQRESDDSVTLPNLSVTANTSPGLGFKINGLSEGLIPPVKTADQKLPYQKGTNPIEFSTEHNPLPIMRGDWFINEVASNYRQRVYYHLAGIPADTGILDIALGIDDEGALVRDNAPDGQGTKLNPIIMRSGFTDSGVSQNHRILERIETQQYSDKALWRSYEFLPDSEDKYQNILNYPFGPVLFPADPGSATTPATLGYECITMFQDPNKLFKHTLGSAGEYLSPITDWASQYWLKTPINFDQFRPTKTSIETFKKLNDADQKTYLKYWKTNQDETDFIEKSPSEVGLKRGDGTLFEPLNCESAKNNFADIRDADRAFNFHGFEYQFMRPNGLQGFATVATNAFVTDFKLPSRVALTNPNAAFVTNESGAQIVIQPLSCLSCHSRGLIPKNDQIKGFVKSNAGGIFSTAQIEKAERIYADHPVFEKRIEMDNQNIKAAIEATGTEVTDVEPIVFTFNKFNQRLNIDQAAANVGVSPSQLADIIKASSSQNPSMANSFAPLLIDSGVVDRALLEKYLPLLIELAAASVGL